MPVTHQTKKDTPTTNIKLHVIETNPHFSDTLTAAFSQNEYDIQHFSTAKEGFASISGASIICVDLMLEDVDGSSLIEDIRLIDANTPIVAFIEKNDCQKMDMDETSVRQLSEACGANALVMTPVHLGELVQTLQRLLPEETVAIAV